jgi:signal transduction histidine kinase
MKTLPHRFLRYSLGILLILIFSLAFFFWLMHPPLGDLRRMAQYLSLTAIISILVGYMAYRLGWMERSPSLHLTLMGVYALASLLAFVNVWVTAKLMFASPHDLLLAIVLLVFAGGIAMVFGFFISSTITDRLQAIKQVAEQVQQGNLGARVPVHGNDELAGLGRTFNQTATRLQEAAQKQRELETLRHDLIAWAGHDLQTPLASIRAIVEALADGVVDDPATTQRYLRTAQRDVQSLSLLIDDLFQMAQLDAGGLTLNREMDSLSDLISDTLESFSELASRQQVALSGEVAVGVDPVFMDVQRIGRVLNNLIGNALRHTQPGGAITVRATRDQTGVRVEVRDTGEGIPEADLPHVFERFYRGEKSRSRATGGAGLGLAISRGIVETHGGQIGVASAAGQGASFYFTLPAGNGENQSQ